MHCSDFVFIISTISKGKMSLVKSVEAAIEKYSAKVNLGSSEISKMELFVTLYDCHKELHLRCCRGPWSARGYKLSFCIDQHVKFPCLQKKLCHYFFYVLWRFVHQWYIFFSEKLINKNDFRHERWESEKAWFWPFEPIWKLKTKFCKYWTSIKFSTECINVKKITQEQWLQLKMKFLLGCNMKMLFNGSNEIRGFLGFFPRGGGGRSKFSARRSIVCTGVSPPLKNTTSSNWQLSKPRPPPSFLGNPPFYFGFSWNPPKF